MSLFSPCDTTTYYAYYLKRQNMGTFVYCWIISMRDISGGIKKEKSFAAINRNVMDRANKRPLQVKFCKSNSF